jgi:hypothetical protein
MTERRPMARRSERGYALLLVFAMASAMAVLLYKEVPRVLFEAQRNKEQLLIERGEQYKRAIQVYYRKNKKLPQRIEDLERGTETRFLRHRYKDPFTGKDDWKLIETDGVNLKNSLVKKPQDQLGGKKPDGSPADPLQTQGQQPNTGQQAVMFNPLGQPVQQPCIPGQPCETNQALQRRASDKPAAAAGQQGGEQGLPACDPAQPYDPTKCDPTKQWDPNAAAAQAQAQQQQFQQPGIPGQSPFPGQPYPGQFPAGQQQQGVPGQNVPYPGQSPYPGQPGIPGIPGFPGGFPGSAPGARPGGNTYPQPGAPISSQTGGAAGSPFQPGGAFPGTSPGGAAGQNQAINLINNLLTTPRQGGIPGQAGAAAMGPGIVGVATKHEGVGIKVYAERTKYQEWEFVYDPKEEKAPNMAGNQQQQQPGNNDINPLGGSGNRGGSNSNSSGTGPMQPSSPFGGGGNAGPGPGFGRQR